MEILVYFVVLMIGIFCATYLMEVNSITKLQGLFFTAGTAFIIAMLQSIKLFDII